MLPVPALKSGHWSIISSKHDIALNNNSERPDSININATWRDTLPNTNQTTLNKQAGKLQDIYSLLWYDMTWHDITSNKKTIINELQPCWNNQSDIKKRKLKTDVLTRAARQNTQYNRQEDSKGMMKTTN